ncbi:MAG: hypothetical protein ACW981_00660 [Candidatus Hodarchaeales archaeon]|jgi:hypothetical protein
MGTTMNIENNWKMFTLIAIGVVIASVFVNFDNLIEFTSDNDPGTLIGALILVTIIFSAPIINRFRNSEEKLENLEKEK